MKKLFLSIPKPVLPLCTTLLLIALILQSSRPEEGLFPLNYINIHALKNAGLKLEAKDIFNPNGLSLTNALVKVGGCTGSFISDDGLIITNHHCVYGGVAGASSLENNYLENGFVAKDKTQEIPIHLPCKITSSYEDVSIRVLVGIDPGSSPSERAGKIAKNIATLIAEEKIKQPEMSIEISEMFVGKSYTLFRYIYLNDVRLVLAPPLTIGQFGGDLDNWEWPRHNGDFSLVRVYTGKDGKPASFNTENIPYKPAKKLKINPNGSKEGDFVFIMGYPGRTFRNETAPYLAFQESIHLPKIQAFYAWYLGQIKDITKNNEAEHLAFAGDVQSIENVEKNYRGKIQGLKRTGMVNGRNKEEEEMLNWAKLQPQYQKIGVEAIWILRESWAYKNAVQDIRYWSQFTNTQSKYSRIAAIIETAKMQWANTEANKTLGNSQKTGTKKAILNALFKQLGTIEGPLNKELETRVLVKLAKEGIALMRNTTTIAGRFNAPNMFGEPQAYFDSKVKKMLNNQTPEQWATQAAGITFYCNLEQLKKYTSIASNAAIAITDKNQATYDNKWWEKQLTHKDALSQWGLLVDRISNAVGIQSQIIEEKIKASMPIYLDMRRDFKATQFIPDANSTLRLTYGYIRRYSPNDGEVHLPYTFLDGVFEKANTQPAYRLPSVVADKLRVKEIAGIFKDEKTGKVVVGLLYNLDTTGGNSGSPVFNDKGELIGINFDRSYTATINDYAWNENYSRSIGCDIRYVLFVMKYISNADTILEEIGITNDMLQN